MTRHPVPQVAAAAAALLAEAGASKAVAACVARDIVANEAEGNTVCGLYYLPVFVDQLRSGRIDGTAEPRIVHEAPGTLTVDAAGGFAQPAIELGLPGLVRRARTTGIAALAVTRSYNALALGTVTGALARDGLLGFGFANAPASVAPPGATARVYGTNPISFAAPAEGDPIVVDQATSAVAKTEVLRRAAAGTPLDPGWAQDRAGRPTLDAGEALAGSLLPAGGLRGANIALMVEVMATLLAGGTASRDAPPLGEAEAPPPHLGQVFLALDPARFGAADPGAVEPLVAALSAAGLGIPGARRATGARQSLARGIELDEATCALLGL